MERADFVRVVDAAKAERPGPWSLPGAPWASETDIADAETALGCRLPDDYHWFVQRFGGGLFGFAEIYSVEPHSRDGVVDRNDRPWIDTSTFAAFADNGCGDSYGWRVVDGVAQTGGHVLRPRGQLGAPARERRLSVMRRSGCAPLKPKPGLA